MSKNFKISRLISAILVIVLLVSQPVAVNADLLDSSFNLNYTGSNGAVLMDLEYSNAAVQPSFSKLADRALALKNGQYSYSSAIQILTETKGIVNKITPEDYKAYENRFMISISVSGGLSYQYTYDSFIMRNVLYTMLIRKASYTELSQAIQIIYDTAVIQSQKNAFRSDALDVLTELNLLASYSTDKDISNMLFYVSNFTRGTSSGYNGSAIPSINVSKKYEQYLKEEYDRTHGGGKVEHNTDVNDSEIAPGGYGDYGTIEIPSIINPSWPNNGFGNDNNNGLIMKDTFTSDVDNIYNGTKVSQYTLCYTLDKSAENPKYYETKITTNQFVTYENIISVIKSAARNSKLLHVEDTNAVLVVYGGSCAVLEKNDVLYDADTLVQLFKNLPDFGLHLKYNGEVSAD